MGDPHSYITPELRRGLHDRASEYEVAIAFVYSESGAAGHHTLKVSISYSTLQLCTTVLPARITSAGVPVRQICGTYLVTLGG